MALSLISKSENKKRSSERFLLVRLTQFDGVF
ncbi:hypothetical protein swp_2340 [Shewanella piezotolerans WP3]|uniref:Uncharacterized protein n=1 Tax=Shewanella piezotolerans (strain WP3 / JCM 13877) TaxID=225849 RepID=B8CNW6_SHEPW|nr:hypothetical protein swp_2340 [Shewanella piezotolerans WP3]